MWWIDPKARHARRIPLRYYPWRVAVDDDGVWVSRRAQDA
jgi:hypothetical protein